jgi:hypothetical protein
MLAEAVALLGRAIPTVGTCSHLHSGIGPHFMACPRNLAVGVLSCVG